MPQTIEQKRNKAIAGYKDALVRWGHCSPRWDHIVTRKIQSLHTLIENTRRKGAR